MLLFKRIESQLNDLSPLYLNGFKKSYSFEDWTLKDFILQFLTSFTSDHLTIDAVSDDIFCKQSKRRSIGDIYRICRYYFDNVTLKEVQHCLAVLWKEKKIGYFYCNSNKKRVYMSMDFYKTHSVNPVQYATPDEYGISVKVISELSVIPYI